MLLLNPSRRQLLLPLAFIGLVVPTILGSYFGTHSTSLRVSSPAAPSDSKSSYLAPPLDESTTTSSPNLRKSEGAWGHLPLTFESNEGQTDSQVSFLARGQGYGLFLTSTGAVLSLYRASQTKLDESADRGIPSSEGRAVLSMQLVGGRRSASISGLEHLPGKANYFIGSDPRKWRRDVPTYSKVRYQNAYPGVDVIYYGNQRQLEYDFVVAAGSDPRRIKLAFRGATRISTDASGELLLTTTGGEVRQRKPLAYQEIAGERREVYANYQVVGDKVSFDLGAYDKHQPLTIDPVLVYSTFLGGSNSEDGLGIAVDAQGSAYLTGSTLSTDFPLAGAFQSVKDSAFDAFVVKLNPAGTALVYSTYLGGNGSDTGNVIAIDPQGNAYVAGFTGSGSFPTTPGVFQNQKSGSSDGFVTKLSPSGSSLVYSTFLGGDNSDTVLGIAVDTTGRAYVAGRTDSTRINFAPLQRNGSPVYKSTNGAVNWSPSAAELTGSTVNTFAIDPSSSNTIYAGSNVGVFKSTDAGAHWNLTGTSNTGTAPLFTNAVVVDPSNPNIIYAVSFAGVHKSTNGGPLYALKNSGLGPSAFSALALAIDPFAPTTLYLGTNFGIYKSTNGADTWVEVKNGIGGSFRINEVLLDPTNSAIVYIGTSRGMFKTTNGGTLWSSINSGPVTSNTTISALTIDPINPSILYAAGFNGSNILFKTTNGGTTWSPSDTGLAFANINTLAIDPLTPTTLYAALTAFGIYKSTNGGASWSPSNTGLENASANGVAVDRNSPATIYAGTVIGNDAFITRLNATGSAPEYLMNFGGNDNDEARGVALDDDNNAYIAGFTASTNFPVLNAFQSTCGGNGLSDAFVTKVNASGTGFVYSTYLGGSSGDFGRAIAVKGNSAYVTGHTSSPNFPLANAIKSTIFNFDEDAFVTKLSPSGTSLDFSTFLGGNSQDQGLGIAVDANGGVYVTGFTYSSDFPSIGAPQPVLGGSNDAFFTKLNPSGTSIACSTYLGGFSSEQGNGVAVDSLGNAYIIGTTTSTNFPTVNPVQSTLQGTDAFVTKLAPSADLAVTITDTPDPVVFGNDLTYTINVKNNGELTATGVVLSDTLAAGASFISATPSKGTCSGSGPVNCAIGVLNANEVATITVIIKPPAARTIDSVAVAGANEPDANSANNTATATTTVDFADLAIVKTVAQARITPGGALTYLLRITNQSGTGAQNLTVTDSLPASLAFVSCSLSGGVCSASGNTVTATFPNLAVGSSQLVVINATASGSVVPGTQISNTASVSGSPTDPQPVDNASTAAINVGSSVVVPKANGRIAFASDRAFTPVGEPTGVYVVNTDGTSEHLFPSVPRNAGAPTWSPDGTKLAFKTNFGSPVGIDVINVDGTGRVNITDSALGQSFFIRGITWSPSGSQVAFVGSLGQFAPQGIIVVGADGKGKSPLPGTPTGISDLAWSPDGTKFLFVKNSLIFVVGVDGNNQQQLTTTEQTSDGPTFDWAPRWSPDGSKVLFMRTTNNFRKLYTMNPDGSGRTQILGTGAQEGSWSPDGTKIVYAVQNELYQSNLDGSNTQRLTNNIYYDYSADWQPVPINTVQFASAIQSVGEGEGRATVVVSRTGDTSAAATIDFITSDGTALQRTDYTLAAGTLRFAAGETAKNINVLLIDDNYVENAESFSLTLSNVEGAQIGSTNVATISITDNDTNPTAPNPSDEAQFFVRQHYFDFLSRLPDQAGFDYWTGQITQCGADPSCLRSKRIDVSNAFFFEQEYQQTGAYVYRLYRAAFGNNQPFPNPFPDAQFPNEEKKLPSYQVFARDRARVRGGASLAQLQLDLANAFVLRPEFIAKYPASVDRSAFVDAVLSTIKNDVGADMTLPSQRQTLIDAFDHGGRGEVLYRLADDNAQTNPFNNRLFIDAEYNRAFAITQYFGYLRRNPDIAGFLFWLGQVNGAALRDVARQHAMVCSFITSTEYQQRFSSVVTHSNAECQ